MRLTKTSTTSYKVELDTLELLTSTRDASVHIYLADEPQCGIISVPIEELPKLIHALQTLHKELLEVS